VGGGVDTILAYVLISVTLARQNKQK